MNLHCHTSPPPPLPRHGVTTECDSTFSGVTPLTLAHCDSTVSHYESTLALWHPGSTWSHYENTCNPCLYSLLAMKTLNALCLYLPTSVTSKWDKISNRVLGSTSGMGGFMQFVRTSSTASGTTRKSQRTGPGLRCGEYGRERRGSCWLGRRRMWYHAKWHVNDWSPRWLDMR